MELEYKLIRTNRKTVGITVGKDGQVTVRAPNRLAIKEIEKIVEKHSAWIEKKKLEIREKKTEELSEDDILLLRRLAQKILPDRLEYFSRITGLVPERVRISSAKSRFGSCSERGNISLSLYVMLYPEAAIDLVIVHELCHLRYMDHSKNFYSLLSKFLPDYKERKALLRAENVRTMGEIKEIYKDFL